jgi:hypothetical protein
MVIEASGRVTNLDGSALDLDARQVLASQSWTASGDARDDGRRGQRRIGARPNAAPPHNLLFTLGDKSLTSTGRRRREKTMRTDHVVELEPEELGEAFLPRRFGCGIWTGAASFSTSSPARFSIATPEARDSLRASIRRSTRRSLIQS